MSLAVLLDENMPAEVASGLKGAGHEVVQVAAAAAGAHDLSVLNLARRTRRWLLTLDADFGDLIFQRGAASLPAVLYFRMKPIVSGEILALAIGALQPANAGHFCVVTREGVRRRALPAEGSDQRS